MMSTLDVSIVLCIVHPKAKLPVTRLMSPSSAIISIPYSRKQGEWAVPRRDTIVPALRVSLVLFVYCDYGVEVMAVAVDTSPVASDFLFGYTMFRVVGVGRILPDIISVEDVGPARTRRRQASRNSTWNDLREFLGTEGKRQVLSSITIVSVKYSACRGTNGTLTWENSGTVFANVVHTLMNMLLLLQTLAALLERFSLGLTVRRWLPGNSDWRTREVATATKTSRSRIPGSCLVASSFLPENSQERSTRPRGLISQQVQSPICPQSLLRQLLLPYSPQSTPAAYNPAMRTT
ncbi:hypothetical protein BGZ61DRAFT_523217 [Ilyonectria robusta]|uniref:uncharacterized protein n=1 Tax=Ilyonectria robusta TaxID=1079257 RepID=UPI001E8CB324|nr:uncharacterized protein BGZ61DRAFT_523217 [Ilyonectria robusta]KAH8661269.1 hypothetical protein BGZ61DRAFT_523217 [Ilyonectria robusta]